MTDERSSVTQYFGSSRHTFSTTRRLILAACPRSASRSFHGEQDLADAEEPDHRHEEVHAAQQLVGAERHAQLPGHRVHADARDHEAERHRDDGLVLLLAAEAHERAEREEIDREEFRRAELQREARDARREERDQQHRHERADERRGEGRRERFGRAALLRHRVAVERRRDRPGLAGNVEEDRGDRPAEERAPVDARQHHDGGGRLHREGERQQDRHAVGAAEPGEHTHEDAEGEAHHHEREDLPREQHAEAVEQQVQRFHAGALVAEEPLERPLRHDHVEGDLEDHEHQRGEDVPP
jgi:hypothetical protein